MEETMNSVYVTKKGKLMDTLERFHIYDETKRNNRINDKNTVHQNIIFDTIIHASTDRGHPAHWNNLYKAKQLYKQTVRRLQSTNRTPTERRSQHLPTNRKSYKLR